MSKFKKLYVSLLVSVAMNACNIHASAADDGEQPGEGKSLPAQSNYQTYEAASKPLRSFYDLEALPLAVTVERRTLKDQLDKALNAIEKFPKWLQTGSMQHVADGHKYPDEVNIYRDYYLNCLMMRAIQHGAMDFVILFAEHGYNPLTTYRFLDKEKKIWEDKHLIRYVAARAAGFANPVQSLEEMNNLCMTMAIFIDRLPDYASYQMILTKSTGLRTIMENMKLDGTDEGVENKEFLPGLITFKSLVNQKLAILRGDKSQVSKYKANFSSTYSNIYSAHSI